MQRLCPTLVSICDLTRNVPCRFPDRISYEGVHPGLERILVLLFVDISMLPGNFKDINQTSFRTCNKTEEFEYESSAIPMDDQKVIALPDTIYSP